MIKEQIISQFNAETRLNNVQLLSVTTSAETVDKLIEYIATHQTKFITAKGLKDSSESLSYIKDRFRESFLAHAKELLFKLHVMSTLYKSIHKNKILTSGHPRLTKINLQANHDIKFTFEVTCPTNTEIDEWKYMVFKFPQRKFYKDLDKQAELFAKSESIYEQTYSINSIDLNDWVCFDIWLATDDQKPVIIELRENFWLKIGLGEAYLPFQEIFLGKKKGEQFFTDNLCFQEYFSEHMDTKYVFGVKIIEILPNAFFSISQLQEHFKIKTKKRTHQKLIEVFSYRNDISLRRTIVEDLLALLLRKQYLCAPESQVLRHQQYLLDELQNNSDYHVYKVEKNFDTYIKQLAEKQVKEFILMDQIAYKENINCGHDDLTLYLNLTRRPRTKEFIYFQHPALKANSLEYPISSEEISQSCLREKTLNHIIHHLENY
jgi:FKBP-type peptidyl-prolyl cis-trans isomerase (trigger factor)